MSVKFEFSKPDGKTLSNPHDKYVSEQKDKSDVSRFVTD